MAELSINDVLGDDLLIEILSWLPSKTVIRCKSVCKHWNSIVSRPDFPKDLIARLQVDWKGRERLVFSVHKERQLIVTSELPEFDLSLNYLPCYQGESSKYARVISSSNGLLLCCNGSLAESPYYICNPLTKQWVSVPRAPSIDLRECVVTGFVCDPSYEINDQGNIVLNPYCRYRVVLGFECLVDLDPELVVDVFSSESGIWTRRRVLREKKYAAAGGNKYPVQAISHDKKIHFKVDGRIVVYDPFQDKLCGEIESPKEATSGESLEVFSCSGGCLLACQFRNKSLTLYMWRLIDQIQGWSLERQVVFPKLIKTNHWVWVEPANSMFTRVIMINPDNPNIVYLCRNPLGLIVSWDVEKGTLQEICECRSSTWYRTSDQTYFLDLPLWPFTLPPPQHQSSRTFPDYSFHLCTTF